MSNEQQSTICVGGPKDGQWIPSSGDSVGERVFFPVYQYTLAELASAFPYPSPAYLDPPAHRHIAYDRIKLQLLTSYGRSEVVQILHHEENPRQGFNATEFLQKLLESYGEPKARWRSPTPEDGWYGRYYYVLDEVDEHTTESWHEPIQIHPFVNGGGGEWMTYRYCPNRPVRAHFFSKNIMVCECVRPTTQHQKQPKE